MMTINLYQQHKNMTLEHQKRFIKKVVICLVTVCFIVVTIKSVFVYETTQLKEQNQILQNKLKNSE